MARSKFRNFETFSSIFVILKYSWNPINFKFILIQLFEYKNLILYKWEE